MAKSNRKLWRQLTCICHQMARWLDALPAIPAWNWSSQAWAEAVCCAAADLSIHPQAAPTECMGRAVDSRLRGPLGAALAITAAEDARQPPLPELWGDDAPWLELRSQDFFPSLQATVRALAAESSNDLSVYEQFLAAQVGGRRRHGVYYTPPALAEFMVGRIHQQWVHEGTQGLLEGWLGPTSRELRIVDPAAGNCEFVISVLRIAHQQWQRMSAEGAVGSWSDAVEWLAPRLAANELLPQAALLGQLRVARTLAELGPTSLDRVSFAWQIGNVLDPQHPLNGGQLWDGKRPSLILGNPPYRSSTPMDGGWIERLMRGRQADGQCAPHGPEAVNYYEAMGRPLGERKVWLQDIYLRFIRWAQWQMDHLKWGTVGFVINHGLLDNVTFRGVREKLLQSFDGVDVVDLHGNIKAHETAPDGGSDDNLFGIATGVAALMLSRGGGEIRRRRADIWGAKAEKERKLKAAELGWQPFEPSAPEFLFAIAPSAPAQYERAPLLTELMPLHSTAPVTARDRVVIDASREDLLARLAEFADLRVSDDLLRERYFRRSRSTRYQRGDTRGWRLTEARLRLAEVSEQGGLSSLVQRCLYRPFDWRWVFWADWMVDWPRPNVTSHLQGDNLAIIGRRQMLPNRPCNYFWATGHVALDGVIRSDNRGSESLFPLWLLDKKSQRRANFCDDRAEQFCRQIGMQWTPDGSSQDPAEGMVGPRELFGYVYGLFHTPSYQREFAAPLRRNFPRVVLPRNERLFVTLATIGGQLLQLHTQPITSEQEPKPDLTGDAGRVRLGRSHDTVREASWDFTVGAYQPLRKWWKSRRHPNSDDIAYAHAMDLRIAETLQCRQTLEDAWQS